MLKDARRVEVWTKVQVLVLVLVLRQGGWLLSQ